MIKSKEIRRKYIEFFKNKGHAEIPSASLIPENDPSTLFISAGMHPLAPFLMGEKHPAGNKLVNSQKCVRTDDIDEIGNKTHHTFFEMLGHWSLGDPDAQDGVGTGYWKEEAIKMSYEFLTQELGLKHERLAFSVFEGDKTAERDEEAADVWKSLGVDAKRIAYLDKKENWWEPAGNSGPCGPDTEMFYWTGDGVLEGDIPSSAKATADRPECRLPKEFDPKDERWVEIGNDVLMQYEKVGKDKYQPAKQKNIDNGTGLERLVAVMNGLDDNYLTDLFKPIIEKIEKLSDKKYDSSAPTLDKGGNQGGSAYSMRIIADHLRAATFIMGDDLGIAPSNIDQGYVVRKLIRRAIRHGRQLGIKKNFTREIGEVVIKNMQDVYSELERNKKFVLDNFELEEEKFTKTLQQGLKAFEKIMGDIDGKKAFDLFQTYGFPLELTQELAKEKNLEVDEKEFNKEFAKHQELSRTASAGKFKGGLADQSEITKKYHTTTHLLLAALRQVLGEHITQKGSNITEKRLRFDFSHNEKMTDEQKQAVEKIVNDFISKDLPVSFEEISLDEAKARGAMGVFGNKYGDKVKVYVIGDGQSICSQEICGGPHVESTGELGKFKIKKEESSAAGVRRIKAILE